LRSGSTAPSAATKPVSLKCGTGVGLGAACAVPIPASRASSSIVGAQPGDSVNAATIQPPHRPRAIRPRPLTDSGRSRKREAACWKGSLIAERQSVSSCSSTCGQRPRIFPGRIWGLSKPSTLTRRSLPAMATTSRSAIPGSSSVSVPTGKLNALIVPVFLSIARCRGLIRPARLRRPGSRKSATSEWGIRGRDH
jgi:hypothetical protein